MEIILKEDVQNLGFKNDIVTVKNGYGRNFLIPTGKAIVATASAKKILAEELKQKAKKLEKIKNEAQALADSLKDVALQLAVKVSAAGAVYGSVTAANVAEELNKKGFAIDKKVVSMKDIKALGEFKAVLKLHKEVTVEVPVVVVAETEA